MKRNTSKGLRFFMGCWWEEFALSNGKLLFNTIILSV
jgi:hypothetical protein